MVLWDVFSFSQREERLCWSNRSSEVIAHQMISYCSFTSGASGGEGGVCEDTTTLMLHLNIRWF